jgi:glycosyltransferase involved in cell wall biosynthesis
MVDLRKLDPSGVNGGLQTYVEWLLPWLTAHHREEFSFLALARPHNLELAASLLGTDDAVCVASDVDRMLRPPGEEPAIALTTLSPQELAKRMRADVLYAPLGTVPFELPGLHSVALIADMLHRELPHCLPHPTIEQRERLLVPTVRNAKLLQCISRSAQKRLEFHYPEARGKTFLTYLPIQSRLNRAAPDPKDFTPPAVPYFFFPANFWPHKNHRALIVSYQAYVARAGDAAWDLMLCGGDYEGNLQVMRDLAESLGVQQKVHIPGYVDNATLEALWRHASALIFPSLHEGFGIPVLEAMAADLPVIAAHAYSLPEVAGDAALYFNPREHLEIAAQMVELSRNDVLRRDLVSRGREQLKKFDAEAEALQLVRALRGETPLRDKNSTMPE